MHKYCGLVVTNNAIWKVLHSTDLKKKINKNNNTDKIHTSETDFV